MNAQLRAAEFTALNNSDPVERPYHVQVAFEEWRDARSDAEFAENCRDFFDSLKRVTGTVTSSNFGGYATVRVDGWDLFEEWQFDNRYPGAKA